MEWVMSVALGLAIGYFVYQSFTGKKKGGFGITGRLHKSVKDRKLSGVCGGIAETLHTDPTIVRLAFILLVMGWGSGVLAYLICAMIFPDGDPQAGEEEAAETEEYYAGARETREE